MADTPRAFDSVTCMLMRNEASPSGPCTTWSPILRWTEDGPGRVVAAPLLDLEDDEAELPAVSRRGSGATGIKCMTVTQCMLRILYPTPPPILP